MLWILFILVLVFVLTLLLFQAFIPAQTARSIPLPRLLQKVNEEPVRAEPTFALYPNNGGKQFDAHCKHLTTVHRADGYTFSYPTGNSSTASSCV